nr:DUF551 domain-containing protein [Limnobaculum sp. M2-1]
MNAGIPEFRQAATPLKITAVLDALDAAQMELKSLEPLSKFKTVWDCMESTSLEVMKEKLDVAQKRNAELEVMYSEVCYKFQVAQDNLKKTALIFKSTPVIPNTWISVNEILPDGNVPVVVWDSTGEGYLIGWRSFWYSSGQRTGEWEWSFQIADMNNGNVNITHWTPLPAELKG